MRRCAATVSACVILIAAGDAFAQPAVSAQSTVPAPPAFSIVRPGPRAVITGNSLVMEADVGAARDSIVRMEFRATYFTAGYDERSSQHFNQYTQDTLLHTDSVPPFQWIWDISGIQDHYHRRMNVRLVGTTVSGALPSVATNDFVVDRNQQVGSGKQLTAAWGSPGMSLGPPANGPNAMFKNGDNTVTFSAAWTADTLYLLVNVEDGNIVPADEARYTEARSWWNGDDVEVFLEVDNAKSPLIDTTMYQIILHPDAKGYGGYVSLIHHPLRFDVPTRGERTDGGYSLACAVPWSALGTTPRRNMRIGLELANVDLDQQDGLFSLGTWSGLHMGNHHNASEWGELVLVDSRPGHAAVAAAVLLFVLSVAGFLWRKKRPPAAEDEAETTVPEPTTTIPSDVSPLTATVMALVRAEYQNEKLNLQYVASRVRKNPKYLSTLFKKDTGINFTAFLNKVRLEQADRLLRTTDKSISHISLEVGYNSYKYFSAVYRKYFGLTPSDVRRGG
jgi:AraC-like DNA-binding protein